MKGEEEHEKNKNYQCLMNLIAEWLEEEGDYDEQIWPELKKYLDSRTPHLGSDSLHLGED